MRHRIALLLAAASLLAAAPAGADPLDAVAAASQTTFDQARAAAAYADHVAATTADASMGASPNVTCSRPVVYGAEVLPHQDLIFAETRQTDQAVATATCVSLTRDRFEMELEITIEYCATRTSLTTCTMASTGFRGTRQGQPVLGVATAVASLTAVYDDMHAAVGKIRRVFACVRTTATGTRCVTYDYSATYGH